jgi:hypothetical protein
MSMPGIAIAIDVDNLLISSAMAGQKFNGYAGTEFGLENMLAWARTFANIICVHLYLPMGQCIKNDDAFQRLWEKYKNQFIFELIYCPKKRVESGVLIDDVDQHLVNHTKKMVDLLYPPLNYFCLASGDLDYSPMLWDLKRKKHLEIAFVIGSENSFSKVYRQMGLAAKHPSTGEDLIHYFSPRTIK